MNAYLAIASPKDDLLFDYEFFQPSYYTRYDVTEAHHQMMTYAALDMVDVQIKSAESCYLGIVDRSPAPDFLLPQQPLSPPPPSSPSAGLSQKTDWLVAAYVTPTGARFLLLHDTQLDDSILRAFFTEAHQAFLRHVMNPFYEAHTAIRSKAFTERIKAAAKRHLNK